MKRAANAARAAASPRGGRMSKPLFGTLPLARLLPQDVHSIIDYAGSLFVGACGFFTASQAAQAAGIVLMAIGLTVSLCTDYRLSLVKLVPIEAHEAMDYILGLAMVASPFLLGYHAEAPVIAALHACSGAALWAMALVTDYRGFRPDEGR